MKYRKRKYKRLRSLSKAILIYFLLVAFLMSNKTFNISEGEIEDKEDNFHYVYLYLYSSSFGHKMSTIKSSCEPEEIKIVEWWFEEKLSREVLITSANLTLNITNPTENSVEVNITLYDDNNNTLVQVASNKTNINAKQSIKILNLEFSYGDNYTFKKDSRIILNLTANNTVDLNYENAKLTLKWRSDFGVLLTCDNPMKIIDIGDTVPLQTYNINVTNTGNVEDTIVIEILDESNEKLFSKLSCQKVTLSPSNSKIIKLIVSPLNMTDGEIANITIKATSLNSPLPIFDFLNTTTVAKKTYCFDIACLFSKNSINWGESTNYTIFVTNKKTTNVAIEFNITSPPLGWNAILNKKNITLNNQTKFSIITLIVSAPKKYSEKYEKKAEITVFARAKNSSFSSNITTITKIKENTKIKIDEIIFSNEKPIEGEKIKICANISNIGEGDVKVLVLFYDGNTNESSIIGIKIMELSSNQTKFAEIYWNATFGAHSIIVAVKTLDTTFSLDISSRNINVSKEEGIKGVVIVASGSAIGIAFLIAIATETGRYSIFKIFVLPLYTRIRKDRVLDHEVRQKVYSYIQSNPGAHFRSIMKNLSLKNGALAYHLSALERAEYIKSQRDGIYRKFYLKFGRLGEPSKILKSPKEMRNLILEKIRMEPGISQIKIAKSIGESRQLVNNYIKELREEGKIYLRKNGRESKCFIEEV